jgi:hypothetical protein
MDRRAFVAGTLALGLLASPLAAEAQPSGRAWRVAVASSPGFANGLCTALSDLGS